MLGLNDFDVLTAPGHLWHGECSAAQRHDLALALARDDIRVDSLNLPALDHNLASCIPDVRTFSIDLYVSVMELAADLGARGVVVVPGRVSGLWPPKQSDSAAWLRDSLEKLVSHAARLDQVLLLESHPQTSIPTARQLLDAVQGFAESRVLVAYDVANAEFVAEDQSAAIRLLSSRLGQIHLSDGTRTSWRHDRVGRGTVDFPQVLSALDSIGYAGPRILELISPDPLGDYTASLAALQEHASHLCQAAHSR